MCRPKNEGGLWFRNMAQFNIALLEKQGWRLLLNSNLLVAQVLKAKYFPNVDFLDSHLGNNVSYTWKSIWAGVNGSICVGLRMRVVWVLRAWLNLM